MFLFVLTMLFRHFLGDKLYNVSSKIDRINDIYPAPGIQ